MRFETLVRDGRLLLERGEPVAAAEALVAEHPLREALAGQLMRALYATGRQADALSVYATTRRRLREELGLEPSATLRDLRQRLLAQTEPVAPGALPLRPRVSVPALLDETIGREAALDALTRLVTAGDAHLVSVVGPGGIGKTRVATVLGHRLRDTFGDGVVFVPLADVQTADDVGTALCVALGVRVDEDGAWSTVDRQLRGRRTLLICDNFEHVVDAAPALVRLLTAAPETRVVVTSRRRLGKTDTAAVLVGAFDASIGPVSESPAMRSVRRRYLDQLPACSALGTTTRSAAASSSPPPAVRACSPRPYDSSTRHSRRQRISCCPTTVVTQGSAMEA